jgi:hypothetical protein
MHAMFYSRHAVADGDMQEGIIRKACVRVIIDWSRTIFVGAHASPGEPIRPRNTDLAAD